MQFWGYLIRYDELALKGKNRHLFEEQLVSNIRHRLFSFSPEIQRLWGRIILKSERHAEIEVSLKQVMGISSFSPIICVEPNLEKMKEMALYVVLETLEDRRDRNISFRVSTNRVDKRFFPHSPQLNREIAEYILDKIPTLCVDLDDADLEVGIEIWHEITFIFSEKISGFGGLPVGSGPRVLTLLSGGIDSPVAAWEMMKRGCSIDFIHFFSYPYTGHQSKEKVVDLIKRLMNYQRSASIYFVSFSRIQEEIQKKCHERFRTVLYRRVMQRISTEVAIRTEVKALVTGESLGQVASQTLENISVIQKASDVMVLRPLITFNKQETIDVAKKIETYDISIRPYEDCCSLFQPKEPATKSRLRDVIHEEDKISISGLVEEALSTMECQSF